MKALTLPFGVSLVLHILIWGFFLMGSIVQIVDPALSKSMPLGQFYLYFASGLVLFIGAVYEQNQKAFFLWSGCVLLLTFFIEVIGVATGVPFGIYAYGSGLGPKWLEVPLSISFAWYQLIGSLILIFRNSTRSHRLLVVPLLLVSIDLVLEKAAPLLGMWKFDSGYPLFLNFVSWGVVGAVATFTYPASLPFTLSPSLTLLLKSSVCAQLLYFSWIWILG